MATKTITKRAFGDVKAPAVVAPAPAAKPPAASGITFFQDIDVTKLRLGAPVESAVDRFCKITTDSGAPLKFQTCQLPISTFSYSPFGAGPTKDKSNVVLSASWKMAFTLQPDQAAGLCRLEEWLKTTSHPHAEKLMPPKGGKVWKAPSAESWADKFNNIVRPANEEKGYEAMVTASVQHVAHDDEGKPRRMPKIQKTTLDIAAGTMTEPEDADPSELIAGLAYVAVLTMSRGGAYFGQSAGIKLAVESILILSNIQRNAATPVDISGMTIVPRAAPSAIVAAPSAVPPVAPGGEVLDQFSESDSHVSPGGQA